MTDKTTPAAPADDTTGTAATEEITMPDDKTGATEAQTRASETRSQPKAPKPEAPDTEAIATRAREAERERVSTIYDLAGRLNLERSFAKDLVNRGVTVDESRRLILDQVAAKRTRPGPSRTFPFPSAAGTSASLAAMPWRMRCCTATARRCSNWKTPPGSIAASRFWNWPARASAMQV